MPDVDVTEETIASAMGLPGERADIVVIGGGPGGSTAAGLLAKDGYHVVLLERARHPREHVGESVIPHFWKYCDRLEVTDALLAEGFTQKAGGTVIWKGEIRQMTFRQFGYSRPALHVERDRFDHILLDNCRRLGAQVFEDIVVSRVEREDDGAMAVWYRAAGEREERAIRCREVLDASGQSALLSRQLSLRKLDEGFRFLAMWGYFDDSLYVDTLGTARPFSECGTTPPTTFVTSIGDHYGWSWHIPLRNNTSVGLVLPIRDVKQQFTEDGPEAFYLETCRNLPYLGKLLESARYIDGSFRMTRDYSYRSTSYTGEGWTLIGDAAAFVDPIFSLGVTFAMYTGTLAAQLIANGLRISESMPYCRWVYGDQLSRRIATARALALPNFMPEDSLTDDLKPEALSLEWEPDVEKNLVHTVALMTDRSRNFRAMVKESMSGELAEFALLDDIRF